ncbi:methyl-accepting chemotaxis protein [Endobacterium cereale]|uniref:methyl-accepting chemotaxis protein n=1 Tax=Endobacterium cereale TaxID=2663029 RepID=UPI002B489414|nr:methyl-accepting chemotaxis protein [Endobacterium cereale]MEB2848103.1 methyl-accepting chemotaxis protein [Endobacterium cereale]
MASFDIKTAIRTNGPITIFVIMTVFGSSMIWFGKLYDFDIVWVTAVPVILMLLYFTLNMLPGIRLHNEQAGDNLYYMGFVFTLTSLGISLYKFTGQASIEDVVRNFGIAIISTIMGIALRIFFNQMRRDPVDIERAVRHELAEMTRRVRSELDSSAREFSSYRRTSNQMLSEGFEEIARQAEKNGEAVRASIEAMSLKATQPIEEASARLVATLEQTHEQISAFAEKNAKAVSEITDRLNGSVEKVEERVGRLASALDIAAEKYGKARSPEEIVKIEVAPAVEELRGLVKLTTDAVSDNARSTQETAKRILTALGPFKQTASSLDKLTDRITSAKDSEQKSTAAMSDLLAGLERIIPALTAGQSSQADNLKRIEALSTMLANGLAASKKAEERAISSGSKIEASLQSIEAKMPIVTPLVAAVQNSQITTPSTRVSDVVPHSDEDAIQVAEAIMPEDDKPTRSWWKR